jgi:two-component system nitrogen regulation response regulator GlnG/two-component system response regulator HydG
LTDKAAFDASTQTDGGPFGSHESQRIETAIHLVIVWCASPERVGEVAALAKAAILGRGPARGDDPMPRLRFVRQRPSSNEPTPLLEQPKLSRVQLALRPSEKGVAFERLGKCPVLHNGVPAEQGLAREGDVITLSGAVACLLESRPKVLPEAWTTAAYRSVPFGRVDAFGMVGESPHAWQLRGRLAALARGSDPILITGASGVGKELAARALHGLSDVAHGEFIARNAATLPTSLVDAELFGTQRNYPNQGSPERPGLIGEADGGTLFLDEIGELPPEQQAHLLRFLDHGEYQRLGDARPRQAKVRVLAATNRDLSALKHDFLARFAKRIDIEGLDARLSDLPLMVSAIVRDFARETPECRRFLEVVRGPDGDDSEYARVHPALLERLLGHDYELHFRELRRLVLIAMEHSAGDHLAESPALDRELKRSAPALEPDALEIQQALSACGGSVSKAAHALRLPSRFALYRLMKRFSIRSEA